MEFSPNNVVVRFCIQGMDMEEKGKPDEAIKLFLQAWNEASNDFEKFTAAHYVARHQANVSDRLKWYETALEFALKVDDDAVFEGPIATLFAYGDEIAPIKALTKAIKDNGIGKAKAGFLAQEFLTDAKVKQLADLPGKDELRAKVVGALGSPLYGIVGVLQANLRNLVYALEQIRVKKGGE